MRATGTGGRDRMGSENSSSQAEDESQLTNVSRFGGAFGQRARAVEASVGARNDGTGRDATFEVDDGPE